jgi:hypothetical protein
LRMLTEIEKAETVPIFRLTWGEIQSAP